MSLDQSTQAPRAKRGTGSVFIPCRVCGKIVKRFAKVARRQKNVFCSYDCQGKYIFETSPGKHVLNGYVMVNAERKKHVREHVAVAEAAIGKKLPRGAVVHHADGNKQNNQKDNLVICQDNNYHLHLHARQRLIDAGGVPGKDQFCGKCGTVKPLTEFGIHRFGTFGRQCRCKACRAEAHAEKRNARINS